MSMSVNTNLLSLNSQRNLGTSQSQLAVSIQRLSSGLRINSAKDDAAGLSISERFSTQIRGLNVAVRNANDAVSLAQTAEGALASVSNNLQRMRELAVQSANATNSSTDRQALQAEVSQLQAEIQRIATQTNFNGRNLIDGSFLAQQFQVGANAGQTISVSNIADVRTSQMGQSIGATIAGTTLGAATGITGAGQFTIQVGSANPVDIFTATGGQAIAGNAAALANAINAAGISGLQATAAPTVGGAGTAANTASKTAGTASFTLNNINISLNLTANLATDVNNTLTAINQVSAATGVSAALNAGGGLTLTAADGRNISVSALDLSGAGAATNVALQDIGLGTAYSAPVFGSYSISYTGTEQITVGGTAADNVKGLANAVTNPTATGVSVAAINISTVTGANDALRSIDAALTTVSSTRADLGAIQNRFMTTIENLQINAENLTASRSRIMDADFAAETSALSRAQILQQAGTAMVAQANQLPQGVLALLR